MSQKKVDQRQIEAQLIQLEHPQTSQDKETLAFLFQQALSYLSEKSSTIFGFTADEKLFSHTPSDQVTLLNHLPTHQKKYFFALTEALIIYQNNHLETQLSNSLFQESTFLNEIRQIRDFCIDEGYRSLV